MRSALAGIGVNIKLRHGDLPRPQVGTRDALLFYPSVLFGNPIAKFSFKLFFARCQAAAVLVGLQRPVLLSRQNDGVYLPRFFYKHGFALGKGANAAKTVFGFGGGDCMVGSWWRAILAKGVQSVET
jgi:hypothetical protein